MATASYYGANCTVVHNLPKVADFVSAVEWGGVVKSVVDTWTAGYADTGTVGSLIYIGKLPKNSIPLRVVISASGAWGWSGTVGWSGDADALGDFSAIAAAGSKVTGPARATANTPTTEIKSVYITTATATLASLDSISTNITYIQGG